MVLGSPRKSRKSFFPGGAISLGVLLVLWYEIMALGSHRKSRKSYFPVGATSLGVLLVL